MKNSVSVVIPTYNEEENIEPLVLEIAKALKSNYEIIFIDDHSTDKTVYEIKKLEKKYPIRLAMKKGEKGKTFSLIQGFKMAKMENIAMIDADLQYPPSEIPKMIELLNEETHIVASYRKNYNAPLHRKLLTKYSRAFNYVFWNLDHDTQSGLKVFKKHILKDLELSTRDPWTFDLEFIVRSKKAGYKIVNYDITFNPRTKGESKLSAGDQVKIAREVIRLRRTI